MNMAQIMSFEYMYVRRNNLSLSRLCVGHIKPTTTTKTISHCTHCEFTIFPSPFENIKCYLTYEALDLLAIFTNISRIQPCPSSYANSCTSMIFYNKLITIDSLFAHVKHHNVFKLMRLCICKYSYKYILYFKCETSSVHFVFSSPHFFYALKWYFQRTERQIKRASASPKE